MFRNLSETESNAAQGVTNSGFIKDDFIDTNKIPKTHPVQDGTGSFQITRPIYDQSRLNREMAYSQKTKRSKVEGKFSGNYFLSFFLKTFPTFTWLYNYKKEYLVGDLISGATVCSMHIPGMGHALLAELPPVVGIYMGFYPALFYGFFASSWHNSIGTFAVLAIMTEKSVLKYSTPEFVVQNLENATQIDEIQNDYGYSPLQVAGLLCFLVGSIQLIMYVLRLGIIAFLLSDCLVSGLTTGAAFQIFSAQLKDMIGVKIPPIGSKFKLIKLYIEIFKRLDYINYVTVTIFLISCALLIFNNEWLKQRVAKMTRFPVPMELIVIVLSILLSNFADIKTNWNVFLVGSIPSGLPAPMIPKFDLWIELLTDAFAIALVSYSVSVSLALLFAQKANYEIDFNQELLAMGAANISGSFFSCFPVSAALGRSVLQFQLGGRTQLASFVNVILIMCILLWVAPIFEILPRCALAAIIAVAIKGLMMQVLDFKKFLARSKMDGFVWASTFLTVTLVAIDIGLLVGTVFTVIGLLFMSLKPHVCMLGHVPGTDLYLDVEKFEKAIEVSSVKIFHYGGTINFATKASFKNRLLAKIKLNLNEELKNAEISKNNLDLIERNVVMDMDFSHLVIDFSALSQIDPASVSMLNTLVKDFNKIKLRVSIAGCSTKVYEALIKNSFTFIQILHPTVHDAVNSIAI